MIGYLGREARELSEFDALIDDVRADLVDAYERSGGLPDETVEAVVTEAVREVKAAYSDAPEVDKRYLQPLVFSFARGYIQGRLRGNR